jgi:hypothetical protein
MLVYQNGLNRLRLYGGFAFIYNFKTNTDISNKVQLQFGFEHAPFNNKYAFLRHFYYAGDIKLRQELDYQSTANIQFGWKFHSAEKRAIRLAFNYTAGIDERGYYQPTSRNFSHVGIYFDF